MKKIDFIEMGFVMLILIIICSEISAAQNEIIKLDINRIAIIGGHRQNDPSPAFKNYYELKPDLCLWIGDNVYADTKDNPDFIIECYAKLEAKPYYRKLKEISYFVPIWDDHDYGFNNSGKEYPLKEESKEIFREFWGLKSEISENRDGVYYSKYFDSYGNILQVINLDIRFNRDLPGSNSDMLGENQWKWFEEELKKYADLRLIQSGTQILLDAGVGSETWSEYPLAKERLFETVKKAGAENVIFITGDQHYAEVCRSVNALDFDAVEITFCGINQIEDPEFNSSRVSPVNKSLNTFVYLDIQWERNKDDIPHLTYFVKDAATGNTEITYRLNFEEIELNTRILGDTKFMENQKVEIINNYNNLMLRYSSDGTEPNENSSVYTNPITISETTTIKARYFDYQNNPRSKVFEKKFEKLMPIKALNIKDLQKGINYTYYEGDFEVLPDFDELEEIKNGISQDFNVEKIADREDNFAIRYDGYIKINDTGVYDFYTYSDDGSKLYIDNELVVDNDGSHSKIKKIGKVALEKGFHRIEIQYFEDYAGQYLEVGYFFNGKPFLTNDFLFR